MGLYCPPSPCCPALPLTALSTPTLPSTIHPLCASPPLIASSPGHSSSLHLPTPLHPSPVPSLPTSSHTYCSGSPCHLRGLEPLCPFLVSSNISIFPGALSCLAHSGSSCPQDPPPSGPPPCLLSQQLLPFHLSAHSCSHVGLFLGGTEPRQLPGEQERAREQEHNQEREESEVVRGQMGPGAWESRRMWGVGEVGARAGRDGDRWLGWRQRAWNAGGGCL